MSWTYTPATPRPTDYIRLLISDTNNARPIFSDEEIQMVFTIQASTWQSGQFWSGAGGAYLPGTPVSYLRVAALLLDSLAANRSRLASIKQLLDVKLDASDAAIQLRTTAQQYRDTDDDAGAFVIIEQCNTTYSFQERFWKTVQRAQGQ